MRYIFRTLAYLMVLVASLTSTALAHGTHEAETDIQALIKEHSISSVQVVGPSWERFTNLDGTGLYHEILRAVFDLYGISVDRKYVPTERAYNLVRTGRADMMTCHDTSIMPLITARYPMYEGAFYSFYNVRKFPVWSGVETLRNNKVVWRTGYYAPYNFSVPITYKEVKNGSSALAMVVLGRADFYVDDLNLIKQSIAQNDVEFDPAQFTTKIVGYRPYYPILMDSPKGRAVMRIYDAGMHRLYHDGTLARIFDKWGFSLPHYYDIK